MNEIKKIFFRNKAPVFFLGMIMAFYMGLPLPFAQGQPPLVKPEWVMPEHYPEFFNGWGRIGYMDSEHVVINDMEYKLSPYIEYNSTKRLNDSIYLFKVGKLAGFLLDEAGEVDTLWLIDMK